MNTITKSTYILLMGLLQMSLDLAQQNRNDEKERKVLKAITELEHFKVL